ncbi:hypothetical protein C3B44_00240 [Corynebacterium yudongzhengii]|uniref:Uncharacterized protein n=1 Tax=Corynebacterium yudongzhengii TaxID=2080740 RepID=A0A2U1T540_9CORY|nr:Rib/alpha-like domain-containing protein [Corynebacterium yudongzhengii]AWB80971.1 hypothetical protein C3B44_00240 [Corynebacterium yudongzhengii]PWC01103.1 hypothetical protein DF222_09005 [Corynebacterium yudongzhengii]
MTNAQSILSGHAYVLDNANLGSTATGNSPVPAGTTVYMQWIDRDGAVSPVYATKTHDDMGGGDGAQNGPGAYVFDLRQPWVDLAGNEHTYTASNGQSYRLWIEPYEDPVTGTLLQPLRQNGGVFPGAFRNSAGADQSGALNFINVNMQRTAVFMAPPADYGVEDLVLPEEEWVKDDQGPISNPAVNTSAKHTVSGRVWIENTDARLDGPGKDSADPAAVGYEVVMSTLTPEGITAYSERVERFPQKNQTQAAIELLRENPDFIATTVVGKTDEEGRYTLRFPEDPDLGQTLTNQSERYLFGFVRDRDGNVRKAYSPFAMSTYEWPDKMISFTPQAVPAQNLATRPMWHNLHFAVLPYAAASLEITNFDMLEKPGYAGQTAEIEVTGQLSDLLPNKIEWTKEDGTVLKTCENLTSLEQVNACTLEIPAEIENDEIVTAKLFTGSNVIAADSFIVKKLAEDLVPNYEDGTVQQGREETIPAPTFDNERTEEKETEPAPEGTTFAPSETKDGDEPANNPDWAEVEPNTGAITIKPGADVAVGDYEVWVEVTYPDGSKDKTSVPITVTENNPDNAAFDPSYEPTNVTVGESSTTNDPFENAEEAAPVNNASTKEGFEADGWTFEVDPNTAVITGNAPSLDELTERFNGLDEGQKGDLTKVAEGLGEDLLNPTVPVEITYGDDTTDETNANFQLVGKDGNPITDPNGDFDGDGVSNSDEIEGGSNPFDENDTPAEEPAAPVIPDPVAKQIETPRGDVPSAESGIENAGDFPEGTTFEWKEQPNVEQPGPIFGTVVVNVPGQDEPKEVAVPITVQSDADVFNPTPQEVSTNIGEEPNSDDGIANLNDLPTGTTTEWVDTPDVSTEGVVPAEITVTYPDGSSETVGVTVKVNDPTDDAGKFDPSYDPTQVKGGETAQTNDPFAGAEDAEVKGANVLDGFQADGWTFEVDPNTAIVTGTAPGLDVLAERFNDLPEVRKGDLVLVGQELNEVLNPNVPVNITYGDDSSETGNAQFQLVGQDGNPITDPNGDFDGDGVSNGDEIEGSSNPFDETSTPEPSTPVDENPPLINPVDTDDREITGTGEPGEEITVTLPDGTEITTEVDDEGNWTVEVPEGTELNPGGTVSANDGNGNKTEITVTGNGTDTDNGSSAGSVDILRCGSSVGISLLPLLLIPGALVGEVFRPQIQEINNRIQQQLGLFNPELARLANEYRHVFQGIAGFTAVLTSIGLIANAVNACSPTEGGSSSSSNNEDEGSSANGGGSGSSIEGGSSSSFGAGSSFGSSRGSSFSS